MRHFGKLCTGICLCLLVLFATSCEANVFETMGLADADTSSADAVGKMVDGMVETPTINEKLESLFHDYKDDINLSGFSLTGNEEIIDVLSDKELDDLKQRLGEAMATDAKRDALQDVLDDPAADSQQEALKNTKQLIATAATSLKSALDIKDPKVKDAVTTVLDQVADLPVSDPPTKGEVLVAELMLSTLSQAANGFVKTTTETPESNETDYVKVGTEVVSSVQIIQKLTDKDDGAVPNGYLGGLKVADLLNEMTESK